MERGQVKRQVMGEEGHESGVHLVSVGRGRTGREAGKDDVKKDYIESVGRGRVEGEQECRCGERGGTGKEARM